MRADETSGTLGVRIQTPEGVVWEGEAQAVSSENTAGAFDILPGHANLITLIERKPIVIQGERGERMFNFDRAIISLKDNWVSVYADIVLGQNLPG